MFEDVRKNKIKTFFIILVFASLITFIIYYICIAFDLGPYSIVLALIFSIISTGAEYYYSDQIVLSLNRARPATEEEFVQLNHILDGLMISSGLNKRPRLYVIDSNQLNAFATGRNPENAVICVTTALLNKLDYYELEGVIAHELSHIKNYDIRLSCVISVMVGFLVMITDLLSRLFFYGSFRDRDRDSDSDSGGSGIFLLVGLICVILSPIFGTLIQLAVSRRREFLADASAAEMTRNPNGLISALRKLDSDTSPLDQANKSTAHMYIANPFKNKKKRSLFSTHPSIEARIEALQNIR